VVTTDEFHESMTLTLP